MNRLTDLVGRSRSTKHRRICYSPSPDAPVHSPAVVAYIIIAYFMYEFMIKYDHN